MLDAAELFMVFRKLSTKDILWLLINAKLHNAAEWLGNKAYAVHEWGAKARNDNA